MGDGLTAQTVAYCAPEGSQGGRNGGARVPCELFPRLDGSLFWIPLIIDAAIAAFRYRGQIRVLEALAHCAVRIILSRLRRFRLAEGFWGLVNLWQLVRGFSALRIAPVSKVEIAAIESTLAQSSLVNAFRLNACICLFCRWYDNSPGNAGAIHAFGAVLHLL